MRRNGICRGLVALLLAVGCRDAPMAPGAPGAAGGIDSAPVRIDLSTAWVRANPSEVGMSPTGLESATNAAAAIPRFRSLLVARHGRLVAESYFGGADSTTLFDVRSVTKSIVCALTGIALRDGVLPGVAAPIARYLAPPHTLDAADSAVTVQNLLTMTTGYQWDEETGPDYSLWIAADDHVQYLLDRAHAAPPGATFTYNSAAAHTLGVVLQDAAAMPLPRYAAPLFAALGVDAVAWEPLDRGTVNGGAGIALRARDLLKLGQLFLQRGWSGNGSVVPEGWVDEATRPQFTWRRVFGPQSRVTYGMLWWVSDATPAAFFAYGYGGQFVYVVPSRDLVVVAITDWTALSETTPQALTAAALGVIVDDVVPAAP
ncbi:MAG TPA: serine hydrolase domain-containing protein [Gemmatimonadales bacterium]|nr:serine hydrolase domain-containing protein [Gemmatimonadales bacterium]